MMPKDFIQRMKALLGDEYEAFAEAMEATPTVSIRLNPKKTYDLPDNATPVPWCKEGFYLPKRPAFTFDPLFHAGAYYVQEASSMFLEQALTTVFADAPSAPTGYADVPSASICLDLCASPGGKSTHLQSLLPSGSLLVSNEVIRNRCMTLAENMTKWGFPDQIITNSDPKAFARLPQLFDIIIADLPCSGEGMFRKDIPSRDGWSLALVRQNAARQRRIICDVWSALKPGGWLIYSTCTFNTEENEENILYISERLGAEIIPIPAKPEWKISGALLPTIPAYRFFPHRTAGEGFFIALLRKKSGDSIEEKPKPHRIQPKRPPNIPIGIKNRLIYPERFFFYVHGSTVHAIQKKHVPLYRLLSENLHIVSAGLAIGDCKGSDFIPSTALAMSVELRRDTFPTETLSDEEAIRYLRKEAIRLPENTHKGYILITSKNTPLGFVKNIGPRANNLYPPTWRIL